MLSSTYPYAGALDTTFNTTGVVPGKVTLANAECSVVMVQPDGKILAGGGYHSNFKTTQVTFAVWRYLPNGQLDSSFGTNGMVTTAVTGNWWAGSLALQSDGKILALGNGFGILLVRYLPNGQLDPSFGVNGSGIVQMSAVTPSGSTPDLLGIANSSLAIEGSGNTEKIYVGGSDRFSTGKGQQRTITTDLALFRYNADGSLDTSFNGTGYVITPNFGSPSDTFHTNTVRALALQANGDILLTGSAGLSGSAGTTMAVTRYLPTGKLDMSFNSGAGAPGILWGLQPSGSTSSYANAALVQSDGAIVLGGYSDGHQALARLTSAGALDTSFGNTSQSGAPTGSNGFAINNSRGTAQAIVVGANGDLLAAGSPLGVSAFLPGGTLDMTFGTTMPPNGTTTDGSSGDGGGAITLQSDGKIVAGGSAYNSASSTYTFILARFLPPNTKIGSFTGAAASYNSDGTIASVTLTASNMLNSYPTSPISVSFFLQNPDNSLTLLGSATMGTDGNWALTFANTYSLSSGTAFTFLAQTVQTVDGNSVLGDPLAQNILL